MAGFDKSRDQKRSDVSGAADDNDGRHNNSAGSDRYFFGSANVT
jgi:hypothetical protein